MTLTQELVQIALEPDNWSKLSKVEKQSIVEWMGEQERQRVKNNYCAYVECVHGDMYSHTPQGDFICKVIDEAINKRKRMFAGEIPMQKQYIKFSLPPQHGKSMHITETLPSYFLGHFPQHGCIEVSYNDDFASKFGSKNRDKIKQFGKDLFGIEISKDTNSKGEWDVIDSTTGNKTRGGMVSRGILSGITGQSLGDLIIIDDPIKTREEANSETQREKIWGEWKDSVSTRIHPGAIIILIMTRWHEDDLWGRLDNNEYAKPLPWINYNLPLEAEKGDLLGREEGEPLWPGHYDRDFIEERKLYPQSFNSLYQGRPSAQEGNKFKRIWWQYYDTLPQIAVKILSVDASFKDTKESAKVAIQVWGKTGPNMYLVDNINAKMGFIATITAINNMLVKHPDITAKYIEDKANGPAIIEVMKQSIPGIIPVKADNSTGGKVARAEAITPFCEAGNIYLPRYESYTHDFVEELASFPNGQYKDQVDAFSQAIAKLMNYLAELPDNKTKQYNFDFEKPKEDNLYGGAISDSYMMF